MSVPNCTICGVYVNAADLEAGDYCPVCYNPTCQKHLSVVRFIWRETGQRDSVKVCQNCKRSYQHRHWDTARRDWIS